MATGKPTDRGMKESHLQQQRAAARRTAWLLGAIAVAVFTAFILSGVLGKG